MSDLGTGVAGESGDAETAASPRRWQEQQSEASDPHEIHSEVRAASVQACDSQTDSGEDNALDLIWELLINIMKQKEGADLTTISKEKKKKDGVSVLKMEGRSGKCKSKPHRFLILECVFGVVIWLVTFTFNH